MKCLAAAAVLAACLATPALAQYGPGYGGYDRPPPPGYGPYGYDRPPPPRYDYDRPPPPYGGPPPGRYGSRICVTSRGNCPINAVVPRNAPCGCNVPGFGYKRGQAG